MQVNATTSLTPEQEELLRRIAASQALGRAARSRDLLIDIVTHAGKPEELTEQQIGHRLFRRADCYNTADDNIVRASVRQLRAKLKEYFETEGRNEPVVLDIPKGAYLPVFVPRVSEVAPATRNGSPLWRWVVPAAVALAMVAWLAVDRARRPAVSAEPDTLMGQFLAASPGPVRFVLTDSALGPMNMILGDPPTMEQYSSRTFVPDGERITEHDPMLNHLWHQLVDRQITSLADVGVLTRTLQTHPSSASRIEVKHAKHMHARDFKTGHFIIMGASAANPWRSLFEARLDFALERKRIVDRHSKKGGPAEYRMDLSHRSDWAAIAWVHNLTGTGSVLLAAGLQFEGTEGAGEFLLNPNSLAELRRLLQVDRGQAFPSFELLLETTMIEGTARSSRIVAWRRH